MVKIAKEKDHSRSKTGKSKFSSGFTNHQQLKSPFSSQIHKMKLKASGSKVRRIPRSVPANLKEAKKLKKFQENEEINLLKKQVQLMQEKLDSIEKAQRQLEASISTDGAASRSKDDDQASKRSKVEDEASKPSTSKRAKNIKRKRRNDSVDEDQLERQAHKVAYIHVGEGGERDLEDHLRGSRRVNLQILSTERLPDIDASDVIHGLDSSGTSRDYVDEGHRCTVSCPVGCQGHLRPNEIVIYESTRYNGRLFERKRTKGRFVTGGAGDDVVVSLDMTDFRRIGGGGRGVRRRREEAAPAQRAEVDRPERAERRPARCRRQDVVERLRERRLNLRFRDGATAVTTNPAPAPSPPLQLGTAAGLTQRLATLLDSPAVSREVAEQHTWNPSDKSFNIVMKADDPMVMRRQPVAQSTDCIRGRVGYTQGIHMWEVTWPARQRGTHAVLGVATREAPLHAVGYQSLVGNSDQSWGWDLGRLKVFHNNTSVTREQHYPGQLTHQSQWSVPDTVTMVLDMDAGSLGFSVAGQSLG